MLSSSVPDRFQQIGLMFLDSADISDVHPENSRMVLRFSIPEKFQQNKIFEFRSGNSMDSNKPSKIPK